MKQLPLFAPPPIQIATLTVCSECTPDRAQRIVAYMRERGVNATYAGAGHTPQQRDWTPEESKIYYEAAHWA